MATNGSVEFSQNLPTFNHRQSENSELKDYGDYPTEEVGLGSKAGALFDVQELVSHTLQFISTANNETLGACLVGLSAFTYLVLGRLGLILIGVIGGIVLHATWEDNIQNRTYNEGKASESKIRRERGLAILERILDWRDQGKSVIDENDSSAVIKGSRVAASSQVNFPSLGPATNAALKNLTEAVIRDHVKYEPCG